MEKSACAVPPVAAAEASSTTELRFLLSAGFLFKPPPPIRPISPAITTAVQRPPNEAFEKQFSALIKRAAIRPHNLHRDSGETDTRAGSAQITADATDTTDRLQAGFCFPHRTDLPAPEFGTGCCPGPFHRFQPGSGPTARCPSHHRSCALTQEAVTPSAIAFTYWPRSLRVKAISARNLFHRSSMIAMSSWV